MLGVDDTVEMRAQRKAWVEEVLGREMPRRDSCWSESLAVGDEEFVQGVKRDLGFKVRKRAVIKGDQGCVLREAESDYAILALKIPL